MAGSFESRELGVGWASPMTLYWFVKSWGTLGGFRKCTGRGEVSQEKLGVEILEIMGVRCLGRPAAVHQPEPGKSHNEKNVGNR
jgi:hypothetical protein